MWKAMNRSAPVASRAVAMYANELESETME